MSAGGQGCAFKFGIMYMNVLCCSSDISNEQLIILFSTKDSNIGDVSQVGGMPLMQTLEVNEMPTLFIITAMCNSPPAVSVSVSSWLSSTTGGTVFVAWADVFKH